MLTTSTITHESTKEFYLPFSFQGNKQDATVKVTKGDGEVNTGKDKGAWGKLTANVAMARNANNENVVRLKVNYKVEELSGDHTVLEFDATQDYPLNTFLAEGTLEVKKEADKRGAKIEDVESTVELVGNYPESYTIALFSGECHDYMGVSLWDRTKAESAFAQMKRFYPGKLWEDYLRPFISLRRDWLPTDDLEMKVDDKGNDQTGTGNIGVKGKIRFKIKCVYKVGLLINKEEKESAPTPIKPSQPTVGSEKKLDEIPSTVAAVLGHGYDICGHYAEIDSVKPPRILNLDTLNKYQRISVRPVDDHYHEYNDGTSIKEYNEKMAESLKMDLSASVYGGFLRAETERSFEVTSEEKSTYRYGSYRSGYKDSEYVVSYYSPQQLTGFLDAQFLEALDNSTADHFVDVFGTHVVLGMALGTRFFFSMRYNESSRKHSQAISVKESASVGYKDTGEVQVPEVPPSKSEADEMLEKLINKKITPEELKAYTEYLKVIQGSGTGTVSSGSGEIDVALGAGRTKTESWSMFEEEKSTKTYCHCIGGDASLCGLINSTNDSQYLLEWMKTNKENCKFCDFVPKFLIPIYQLIPDGHKLTAEAIKRASEDHQQWAVKSRNMRSGIKMVTFETIGDANTRNVQSAAAKDHDEEIGTKQGKNVHWKLTVQLLNVEDGGRCGFGISLRVSEGGSSSPSSVLLNTYTKVIDLDLGLSQMSINTDYFGGGSPVFTAEDTWTGQFHGWHDATNSVLRGTAGTVLCHDGNTVEIMVDDKGKDLGHIGVKGTIMIPWIGY